MLTALPEDVLAPEQRERVVTFLARGAATGTVLDSPQERGIAQGVLNYWTATLYTSNDPSVLKSSPRTHVLADFDEKATDALSAAADAALARLSEGDHEAARRSLLRLVQLKPTGLEFFTVTVPRSALEATGHRESVARAIAALEEVKVLRVDVGAARGDDHIALRYESYIRTWHTLHEWLEERRRLRTAADLWEQNERSDQSLWEGKQLAIVDWYSDLNQIERDFIAASERKRLAMENENRSASDIIIEAFESGRPIVPLIGAGVSVGTGFPSMAGVTTYLAKVQFYIRNVAVNDQIHTEGAPDTTYLRQHGWPELNQLNAEVWRYLYSEREAEGAASQTETEDDERFTRAVKRCQQAFRSCGSDLSTLARKLWVVPNHRVHLITQLQFLENLSDRDWGAAAKLYVRVLTGELSLRGDWYDLLVSLTEGDFDLVAALFSSLGQGRTPAAPHVFLAQLVDALQVRLFLSLNFDPFLETALWAEGHAPGVVEIAKNADLPSQGTIGDRLTVLKLYGGPYGQRIDEAADTNMLHRAARIIPPNALIVVMGFSGYERRVTQVLMGHAKAAKERDTGGPALLWMNYGTTPDKPVNALRSKINEPNNNQLVIRNYSDVSLFLLDVLTRQRLAHPAGRERYRCLPTMPWADHNDESSAPALRERRVLAFYRESDWDLDGSPVSDARGHSDASMAMARFCREMAKTHQTIWVDCEQHHTVDGIVVDVLDSIRRFDPAFPPLLVQAQRAPQPHHVPPAHKRSVERIREALQRGNYILCFDSPETIGRPQTVHHGTPSLTLPEKPEHDRIRRPRQPQNKLIEKFEARVTGFFDFLTSLLTPPHASDIAESFVCVALAPAAPRHLEPGSTPGRTLTHVDDCIKTLKRFCSDNSQFIDIVKVLPAGDRDLNDGTEHVTQPSSEADQPILEKLVSGLLTSTLNPLERGPQAAFIVPMVLSVFRRPRSYLGYLALLKSPGEDPPKHPRNHSRNFWDQLFGPPRHPRTSIDFPCEYMNGMCYLGGGLLWIPRRLHNRAYNRLTDPGHRIAKAIRDGKEAGHGEMYGAVLSLLAAAFLHRRAARYYFSELYEATGDIVAFREYIYHRVSYLRYLCRLLLVTNRWAGSAPPTDLDARLREHLRQAINKYRHLEEDKQLTREVSTWGRLRLGVRSAWFQELKAFRATLSREFETVRQRLYAGTWVSTIDRLGDFDLEEMHHPAAFRTPNQSDDPEGVLCRSELEALMRELDRQKFEARFEMADWSDTLRDQQAVLHAIEGAFASPGRSPDPPFRGGPTDSLREAYTREASFLPPAQNPSPLILDVHAVAHNKANASPLESARVRKALPLNAPAGGPVSESAFEVVQDKSETRFSPFDSAISLTPAGFVYWFVQAVEWADGLSRLARASYEKCASPAGADNQSDEKMTTHQEQARRIASRLGEWLVAVDELTETKQVPPFSEEIRRFLRERLTVLALDLAVDQARFQLDKFNPWLSGRTREGLPLTTHDALGGARWDAIHLFEQARRTIFQDVRTYNKYRAKSLRMVSQADILMSVGSARFLKPIADLNLALRLLHRSRGADPLEEVACYRTKAEALMLWSDALARGTTLPASDQAAARAHFDAPRARLDAARSMIARALEALSQRPRNVPWWLRLCHDRAQWAVVSCVLRVWEARAAPSPDRTAQKSGAPDTKRANLQREFEIDLRYGLDAIRAGIDGLLPVRGDEEDAHKVLQWKGFARLWLSLAQATEAFNVDERSEARESPTARPTERLETHWARMNQAARMPQLCQSWAKARKNSPLDPSDPQTGDYAVLFHAIAPPENNHAMEKFVDNLLAEFKKIPV
ncbi:hypothetical protein [Gemmata sp. SH-PL17]|uniref:nSTAND1 domain-containing NTPase n=1 Tax=Gemmata sp. SH-PL17 TaxID=1630693 RepID=UPI0012F876E3|nr:hypothetical protein [Gemmata sp. SH-PL17]